MKTMLWSLAVLLVFLGIWEWVVVSGLVSPILLPSPADTARYIAGGFADGVLTSALIVTLSRLVIGYAMGLGLGLGAGLLLYKSPVAQNTLGLAALGLQTLPSVCWTPLAILWFGQTEWAMYFVVVMGSMWAMAIATENAIRSVPPIYAKAARVMGSRGWNTWRTVTLPAALPQIIAGAKLGWAFAWRSLMASEIYVTIITRMGLGQLLHFGRELNAMEQVIGVMILIIIIGLFIDRCLFVPLERYLRNTRGI